MNSQVVLDAGPALNFFSLRKERLLFAVFAPIAMPETVHAEVLRKAARDARFEASATVLNRLPERLLEVLDDDAVPPLSDVAARIARMPLAERMRQGQDLGELMVIAHGVVAAEAGAEVVVIIDERTGRSTAQAEARRLDRIRATARACGTVQVIGTRDILTALAGSDHVPDRHAMRNLYDLLRGCDDGLPPIDMTDLLSASTWNT
ncbi:hypothetical protein AD006_29190 (plasmid) [Pseudonocardia sp. EC080610-09]|uniref:hypothetical protein n=1 Tax=unclassified Pseudonocardia TaxID=2619320 RepID=UPI00070686E5|nr:MULTISPECIES: hypothetical protein [unclassified Pseudonocardia]ALL79361.1 hypothetical protein AD006_29190 [Pseudonocardia sp. EC080610-09]ALL85333.1 hypothetical protein AD017_29580 [Pseudonocardia sp. EC080619-01]